MFCQFCGNLLSDDSGYCSVCGQTQMYRQQKPKKHFPVLIPVLILCILFVSGLVLFFLNPIDDHADPITADPTIVYDGCYELVDGTLYFYEESYTGGPVLTIPSKINGQLVTAIGEGAFYDCDTLTTIILPGTLREIGAYAFAECSNLRGMEFPDTLTYIGEGAFENCIAFEAAYVPAGVSIIEAGAFDGCSALAYIFYDGYFDSWDSLYPDYINPFTCAVCRDGYFYQGTK